MISNLRFEAGYAVAHGLNFRAALRAITQTPAEILALGNDYGTLQVGRVANLIVWSGDPFEPSTEIHSMIVAGELLRKSDPKKGRR